jgi:hypothetical protein
MFERIKDQERHPIIHAAAKEAVDSYKLMPSTSRAAVIAGSVAVGGAYE